MVEEFVGKIITATIYAKQGGVHDDTLYEDGYVTIYLDYGISNRTVTEINIIIDDLNNLQKMMKPGT